MGNRIVQFIFSLIIFIIVFIIMWDCDEYGVGPIDFFRCLLIKLDI